MSEVPAADPAPLRDLSVLVLEDDFYLAVDLEFALEDAGARVLGPCASVDEALELIAAEAPDCAVLDINIGAGPNFTVARVLHDRGVPFLFVTGYDRAVIPADLASVGSLQKPVSSGKVVRAVRDLCGRKTWE